MLEIFPSEDLKEFSSKLEKNRKKRTLKENSWFDRMYALQEMLGCFYAF